jgi:hypothetical protein
MAAQAVATAGVENGSNVPKQFGNLPNRGWCDMHGTL